MTKWYIVPKEPFIIIQPAFVHMCMHTCTHMYISIQRNEYACKHMKIVQILKTLLMNEQMKQQK